MQKINLIVAGGGTGGHVSAGISLARAWQDVFKESAAITYVGAFGGIEEKMVPREKIPLFLLRMGSLNKVSILQKINTLLVLPFAFLKAFFLLLYFRPKVVIGVGGYASGPVVLIASYLGFFWKCKTAILEQNSVPGMTNKILSKKSKFIFTAFPIQSPYFSTDRTFFFGNPVRSQFSQCPPSSDGEFQIFVFGGSQGAVGLNTLFINVMNVLKDNIANLKIIHQTGVKDFERVKSEYIKIGLNVDCRIFIDDMAAVYKNSNLIICRAGASSLTELAAMGRATVLVPLPTASDNHQQKNADFFVEKNAALCVLQNKDGEKALSEIVLDLFHNRSKIHELESNILKMHRENAALAIVKKVISD